MRMVLMRHRIYYILMLPSKSFSVISLSGINGNSEDCNSFDFLISFILYTDEKYSSTDVFNDVNSPLASLFRLVERYSHDTLTRLAYNASHPNLSDDPVKRRAAFEFCYDEVTGRGCSIVTYHVQRSSSTINDYFFFVPNGSCSDSFSTPYWQSTIPPAPLEESYKQCRKSSEQAFFDALGIAFSNAGSIAPLAVGLIVFLYTQYIFGAFGGGRDLKTRPVGKKITKQEKDAMAETLAGRLCKLKIEGTSWSGASTSQTPVLRDILREMNEIPETINPLLIEAELRKEQKKKQEGQVVDDGKPSPRVPGFMVP